MARAKLSPSERRQCLPTLAKSSLRKARKGRRSMVEPRCVPSCSRRSVFCLFLRLLEATESQPFTQRTLQEMGVPQYRQALTLLKGLELVTPAGRLQDDVLASRHDPERFKTLLHGRVSNGLECRRVPQRRTVVPRSRPSRQTTGRAASNALSHQPLEDRISPIGGAEHLACAGRSARTPAEPGMV